MRTPANLTGWPPARVEALRRLAPKKQVYGVQNEMVVYGYNRDGKKGKNLMEKPHPQSFYTRGLTSPSVGR